MVLNFRRFSLNSLEIVKWEEVFSPRSDCPLTITYDNYEVLKRNLRKLNQLMWSNSRRKLTREELFKSKNLLDWIISSEVSIYLEYKDPFGPPYRDLKVRDCVKVVSGVL